MPVATLTNIDKSFGQRTLFERANLNVYRGERIGLIGDNGSGKSTLFRILAGQMEPDAGSASVRKSMRLGYLTQDPVFDPANSVIDEAELAFAELHDLSHRLRQLEHDMGQHAPGEALERILRQYQTAQHEFDLAGGYAWRHKLEATLLGVGLERISWEQNVQTLSGGQRSRLALAKLLISEPDLLLLDEPTNHLDLVAIEWLERYLLDFSGAVILISHDRYLLDRLSTRIVWLSNRRLHSFPGNYTAYQQQRELLELSQQRAYEKQQADIEKQQEFIRRFSAGQRAKEARGRATRLNRMLRSDAVVEGVKKSHSIHLSLGTDQRAGDQVLQARELSKAYGDLPLWKDLALHIRRGERIGLIGPNGSGKTTLLEVLLGERDADAGHIRWGANLSIGYYDQHLGDFDADATIFDTVRGDRDLPDQQVREVLAMMLFRGDEVEKLVGTLSGGERARVRLAQLLLDRPNVLVLDEPTNHLDIASREALESALAGFEGTILCVSHDRYFLDRTIKRLLILRPPDMVDFDGNYSRWVERLRAEQSAAAEAESRRQAARKSAAPAAPPPGSSSTPRAPKKDNPYTRPFGRLTLEQLEQQIHFTEQEISACQSAFGDPALVRNPAKAQQLQADYESLAQKLQALEEEYFARET